MKIVADANILWVRESFSHFGELVLVPGREIGRSDIKGADALLVRSVTSVNAELLRGSKLKFVASATSGTDHIDLDYLKENNIGFADAKGSNANAVVDYCFAALAYASVHKGLKLGSCEVGIVGAGNVGGLLAKKLNALNIRTRLCDPFLQRLQLKAGRPIEAVSDRFFPLEEVLGCDVVSLHVPLTVAGEYPTQGLIDASKLALLQEGAVLINTSRGSVVNEQALGNFLQQRRDVICVFDVWENEPAISVELAAKMELATPHIAGYSQESKMAATAQMLQAFQQFFGLPSRGEMRSEGVASISVKPAELAAADEQHRHWLLVLQAFQIHRLSEQFKNALSLAKGAGGKDSADPGSAVFDEFRKQLVGRREFSSLKIQGSLYTRNQLAVLQTLGFKCE